MKDSPDVNIVLILGSSPDVLRVKTLELGNVSSIVAINNAWKVRDDWHYHIHPEDYPKEKHPSQINVNQRVVTCKEYVPAQNNYGGFIYGGGTMAFTAGYWALHDLKPTIMAFIGCDMIYPKTARTHFYGLGSADPLREDVTLQNLEAKSMRLQVYSLFNQCLCVNLSSLDKSRLVFPRISVETLAELSYDTATTMIAQNTQLLDKSNIAKAEDVEKGLGYFVSSGEYWKYLDQFDATKLSSIDKLWLSCQ